MSSQRSRRRLLQHSSGLLVALSGCTTVVDHLSNAGASENGVSNSRNDRPLATGDRPNASGAGSGPTRGTDTGVTSNPAEDAAVASSPPTLSLVDAPLPGDTGGRRYATMGRSDATATLFGNWKCPFTRDFVVQDMDAIVDEYVRPGDLALQFRSLAYRRGDPFLGPDAPRAARAGLGVWRLDPEAFWSYFARVFENQPPERRDWATTDRLVSFASSAGVSRLGTLESAIERGDFEGLVRRTVERSIELEVFTVPRIATDGDVTAPTVDLESTRDQLDRAVGR